MERLIFRCDDISSNTNHRELNQMLDVLENKFKSFDFWYGVNLFSKKCLKGSVYPNPPFKEKPLKYFWNVNQFYFSPSMFPDRGKPVSHGLFHVDHSQLTKDAQEMSILGSCHYIKTDIFVPPFNRWNEDTDQICKENGIHLAKFQDGWRSLEHEPFDPKHKLWYFHAWRFTPKQFEEVINGKHCTAARK